MSRCDRTCWGWISVLHVLCCPVTALFVIIFVCVFTFYLNLFSPASCFCYGCMETTSKAIQPICLFSLSLFCCFLLSPWICGAAGAADCFLQWPVAINGRALVLSTGSSGGEEQSQRPVLALSINLPRLNFLGLVSCRLKYRRRGTKPTSCPGLVQKPSTI